MATSGEGTLRPTVNEHSGAHRPVWTSEQQHSQTGNKARGRAEGPFVTDRRGALLSWTELLSWSLFLDEWTQAVFFRDRLMSLSIMPSRFTQPQQVSDCSSFVRPVTLHRVGGPRSVTPSSADRYLSCFYGKGRNLVKKIFPAGLWLWEERKTEKSPS